MDGLKDSPMPPADAPFNPSAAPLAPSQEAAYRKKCIALKKRLTEIEANNDAVRRRIEQEKQHVQKMRLMRAILLNHLKQIGEAPGKALPRSDLEQLGIRNDGMAHISELVGVEAETRSMGEPLLDDTSDESEEDPEPAERPERRRRPNKSYRESIMTTTPGPNPSMYQQPGLPNLAPAGAFSTSVPPEPASLTSSFRVQSTPQASFVNPTQPVGAEVTHSSPAAPGAGGHSQPGSFSHRSDDNATSSNHRSSPPQRHRPVLGPQPVRPTAPFTQFTDHMRPQLEADNYPADQIDQRIDQEWRDLSTENKGLWEKRYADQMKDYTIEMDAWKREQKKINNSVSGASFSESRNRT